jgi:hypothetical protein
MMLTKRNALLAASAAVLVAVAGDRAASASDSNWDLGAYGSVPWDAVGGGFDTNGDLLYFCRAFIPTASGGSGAQPGKVNYNLGSCRYGYGGKEVAAVGYEVLVPHWESASNGAVPPNSFPASIDTDQYPLYPCRASYYGGLQVGKLKQGAGCYIGYGGREVLLKDYEVLQEDMPLTTKPDDLLDGFIIGGYEANQSFYLDLCVANYNDGATNSLQPGKVVSSGSCHFSYGGREYSTSDFSLVEVEDISLNWFTAPRLPAFDFVVGQDTNGQPLYACATFIPNDNNGSLQLGKYRKDFAGCHVGWGGHEVTGDGNQYLVDGLEIE